MLNRGTRKQSIIQANSGWLALEPEDVSLSESIYALPENLLIVSRLNLRKET